MTKIGRMIELNWTCSSTDTFVRVAGGDECVCGNLKLKEGVGRHQTNADKDTNTMLSIRVVCSDEDDAIGTN